MRPTSLKPGDSVTMSGIPHPMTFVSRSPRQAERPEYEFFFKGSLVEPLRVSGSLCQIRQPGRRPRWVALTAIERREVIHA